MGQPLDEDEFTTEAEVNTEANEGDSTTEDNTEAPVEGDVTPEEAAAKAEAEAKAEAAAEKELAHEIAFEEFKNLVNETVAAEGVDTATGVVPAGLISPVALAFTKLGGTKHGRAAAKNWVTEQMQGKMLAGTEDPTNFAKARSYLDLFNALNDKSVARERVVQAPVDPTEAFVGKIAALMMSPNLALPPEGVDAGWRDKVKDKVAELRGQVETFRVWLDANSDKDEADREPQPEVDELVLAAYRVAAGKATRRTPRAAASGDKPASTGGSGVRRDVGAHIAEAFASHPSGHWLTVSEIANFTSQEYGDEHPSSGAVSARLFPKSGNCTVEGITPGVNGVKGAYKA